MLDIHPDLALITLDHPPVNSLNHDLRARLAQQIHVCQADPTVRAIVLAGSPRAFSAGADIREFGTPRQVAEPILPQILVRIEASAKPVVAAITGVALGGGLELALACHARVAAASARVGLPEITLGLIPGAGGTQRLPRLIGLQAAYALMTGGVPQAAQALQDSGLFDAVLATDTLDEVVARAAAVALKLAKQGPPWPGAQSRSVDAEALPAQLAELRATLTPQQRLQPAYGALLDALAAVRLPLAQGVQTERALFMSLVPTRAARAQRYLFQAERAAKQSPMLETIGTRLKHVSPLTETLCRRALLVLVNEAALLLATGSIARASDIDVVMVRDYGFPRWEGGPVFWARQQERSQLEADLRDLARVSGPGWVLADVAPLFAASGSSPT